MNGRWTIQVWNVLFYMHLNIKFRELVQHNQEDSSEKQSWIDKQYNSYLYLTHHGHNHHSHKQANISFSMPDGHLRSSAPYVKRWIDNNDIPQWYIARFDMIVTKSLMSSFRLSLLP